MYIPKFVDCSPFGTENINCEDLYINDFREETTFLPLIEYDFINENDIPNIDEYCKEDFSTDNNNEFYEECCFDYF